MSQAKVDRYKNEKKNRTKTLKRKKIIKVLVILVICFGLGVLIGFPLGKGIYNYQKKKAEQNATVSSLHYSDWFDQLWVDNYSDYFTGITYESNEGDTTETTTEEATEETSEDTTEVGADSTEASSVNDSTEAVSEDETSSEEQDITEASTEAIQ